MPFNPEDLSPLEVAFLGVLCVGLPPSRAAGGDTFRADHVTAVVAALRSGGRRELHLGPDGVRVTPAFAATLRDTIESLVIRGILARPSGSLPAAPGMFEAGLAIDLVNPDDQPAVLDRYLAQQCMEQLFDTPAVYPFLMERYTSSGAVWRRLREGGYAT